jgi:hypothetical protein
MIHSSRHLKWLPVVAALAVVGAFIAAGTASANHPNTGLSPSLSGYLVPVYAQCNAGSNVANGTHSPPLGVQSCPANLQDGGSIAAVGPDLNKPIWPFNIRYTAPGVGAACGNGQAGPTVCLDVTMNSLVRFTTPNQPYTAASPYTGSLAAVARIRFTDHYNCQPKPCSGPFTQTGTGTDLDFGPVPFSCAVGGTGKSACQLTTDANSVVPGSVVSGIKTNIQIFRIRVNIPTNPAARQLLAQQGIAWP